MSYDTALKRPALYNPALWSRDEVRTYYVARHRLLDRFLDDFRREKPGTRPQHRLILGQRGMGKSTLLRRLAIGVDDDAELAGQWLPLVFPEEQYNIATLADFWLNCLDALGDFLEARGDVAEMKAIDAEVERLDRKDGEGALQTLLRLAKKLDRRLLLLVDNIDLVLERIKDKDWVLREALQEHPELLLVGASSRALEATYDYGAAFYDFFKIDELRGLSEIEMRETIVTLARQRGAEEVARRVESDPGRLRVLHTLTGGNPRTAVLLYGVLLKGVDGDVRSDLEGLLDEVTPLYKARFDELPPQGQQLLDKVALHWDPISARQAADALGWTVNLASAQLDRLVQAGVLEKVKAGKGKRMAFQVAERFFNIWYLMRASRRVRRKLMWLVEFLRVLFSSEELQRLARDGLNATSDDARNAEYYLALCRAMGPMPVARALETRALEILLSKHGVVLEEIFDVGGEDRDLAAKAKRITDHKAAGKIFRKIYEEGEKSDIPHLLLGLPVRSEALLKLAKAFESSTLDQREALSNLAKALTKEGEQAYGKSGYAQLSEAFSAGYLQDDEDVEGGESAALKFGFPLLAIIPKLNRGNELVLHTYETLSREALRLDNSGVLYWVALAEALEWQGRYEELKGALVKAKELAPDNLRWHVRIAEILTECPGEAGEAERCYRQVISSDPQNVEAIRGLAYLLGQNSEKRDEAMDWARKLTELWPENSRSWSNLAAISLLTGADAVERLAALERAYDLADDNGPALALMLVHYLATGLEREIAPAAGRYFEYMSSHYLDEAETIELKSAVGALCGTLRNGYLKGVAGVLLAEFDKTDAAQRFRAIREALNAAVEGSVSVLDALAPEVRKPALDILAIIAPELVTLETISAPL